MRGIMVFQCGAMIGDHDKPVEDPRAASQEHGNMDKLGRCRITVSDTDGGLTRPSLPDGTPADCASCQCKRKAGHVRNRYFPDGHQGNEPVTHWRYRVSCLGRFVPVVQRQDVGEAIRSVLPQREEKSA